MRNLPTFHRARLTRMAATTSALALGSVLLLSGCGTDAGEKGGKVASLGAKSSTTGAPAEAAAGEKGDMVKYAGCMREHGVDVADPNADGSMTLTAEVNADGSDSPETKKREAADDACRKWLPSGGVMSEKDKAKQLEDSLKLAKCMRDHGIDVPDPKPGELTGIPMQRGTDEGKTDEALKACGVPADGSAVAEKR